MMIKSIVRKKNVILFDATLNLNSIQDHQQSLFLQNVYCTFSIYDQGCISRYFHTDQTREKY